MSLSEFRDNPWRLSHAVYEASAFNIRPAPEFATAEVVLAATYRAAGFAHLTEKEVPAAGRKLDRAASRAAGKGNGSRVSAETWRAILHGGIESPKQPNQSAKRFLQLCPVVPDVALYSGSARLSGNSWAPGELVKRMVRLGSSGDAEASALWGSLFEALSVSDDEDIWARWLQGEFEQRRSQAEHGYWELVPLGTIPTFPDLEKPSMELPAVQFVRDLRSIIDAKPYMTRRQWVSLLESVLRLGAVAHVLWLCDVNHRLWRAARGVLDGSLPPSPGEALRTIIGGRSQSLVYGMPGVPMVRDLASRYLVSRLGLNLLMWNLEERGDAVGGFSSSADVSAFLALVARHRSWLLENDFSATLSALHDSQARALACKKGIGSNLVEFCRHALGQRQTGDPTLRGYDQGYYLKKRAEYNAAPWIVSLGPVALLALVHCCLVEAAGPRSVQRLCEHLALYGISLDRDAVTLSDLGKRLRMLGLILDSPDAESGMLLLPPFEVRKSATAEGSA